MTDLAAYLAECNARLLSDAAARAWLDAHRIKVGHRLCSPLLGYCGPLGVDVIEDVRSLLVPEWHVTDVDPWGRPRDLELVDLVAVDMAAPGRFQALHDNVSWLGEPHVWASGDGEPLRVLQNPLAWLRADGAGAVILDEVMAPIDLRHAAEIIADDVAHMEHLTALMREPVRAYPKLLVAAL